MMGVLSPPRRPGSGPRRPGPGCASLRVLGAVLIYLAASQGPVVAELVHQVDHLVRAPVRASVAPQGEPTRRHSHRVPTWDSPQDHSHGAILDGILAAAEEAEAPAGVAIVPVMALHLPGGAPVRGVQPGRTTTAPRAPVPSPVPGTLQTPPTPPPRG